MTIAIVAVRHGIIDYQVNSIISKKKKRSKKKTGFRHVLKKQTFTRIVIPFSQFDPKLRPLNRQNESGIKKLYPSRFELASLRIISFS